jgi:hypothetical protein
MNDQRHRQRIERWLRFAVALIVPLTLLIGLWLLVTARDPSALPHPAPDGHRVYAFPAEPGPPSVTLPTAPGEISPPAASSR